MPQLKRIIETAFDRCAEIKPTSVDMTTSDAIKHVINALDSGDLRVAEKINGIWITHHWLKKAVLLSFHIADNQLIEGAETRFFDKIRYNLLIGIPNVFNVMDCV